MPPLIPAIIKFAMSRRGGRGGGGGGGSMPRSPLDQDNEYWEKRLVSMNNIDMELPQVKPLTWDQAIQMQTDAIQRGAAN